MNTTEFLSLVLPAGEHYFAAELRSTGMVHHHASNTEELAARIGKRSKSENNIYYSMASYKQESYINAKGKTKQRTQENVDKLRCFWVDLDCKGKESDYADQTAAAAGLKRFAADSGVGLPTVVVNSGYGLHAYWVLDRDLTGAQWMSIAIKWRATLDAHGVKHDPSCTTDSARILRPIGTLNHKPGNTPTEVKYVGGPGTIYSTLGFVKSLGNVVPETTLPRIAPIAGADMSLNEAAIAGVEYQKSYVKEMVTGCALAMDVLKRGGDVSEPLWHKMIGLVKHTVEGPKVIHNFSNKHPDYSHSATEEKSASWEVGPPSCAVLERDAKELPPHCASCKHRGAITTPLQLGYQRITVEEKVTVVEAGVLVEKTVEIPPLPASMDDRFRWHGGKLQRNMPKKEGSDGSDFVWKTFCHFHFYPFSYYDDEEDRHVMMWRLREREGVFREFKLTGGAMSTGGAALFKELGQSGILAEHGGKQNMEAYLTAWFNETKKNKVGSETYLHFGWHGDDFLLGTTLLKKDGEKQEARLGGDAAKLQRHFEPKGTLDRWKYLINSAYNRRGQEQYQFLLGVGLGSPLVKLMNITGGVVFSAVSYESGQGKSTTAQVAAGIYACGKGGNDGITLTKQQATHKAVFAMAGVLHSLPLMVDEVTNTKADEASDIVYTYSQGSARIGLTQDGRLNYSRHGWAGNMIQTSNKPLTSIITGAKPGADAELARLVEFTFENVSPLAKSEADEIFSELIDCYGHAGMEYMSYVVSHQEEVTALLKGTQKLIDRECGMTRKDRFWSVGIASAVAGIIIAKKVGLVQFDVNAIISWVSSKVRDMRHEIDATTSTPAECFTLMLTELAPGLIITDIEGDKRSGTAYPSIIREPRAPYTGRIIASTSIGYIVQSSMHAWCTKHQVSLKAVIQAAVAKGWIMEPDSTLRYPGKGTPFAMGQSRCYTINWARLENSLSADPHMAKVIRLMEGVK